MKKLISSVVVAVLALFFASSATLDTYADDIQVNFRITNHAAKISIRSTGETTDLTPDDKIPDTIVTYKNAIRAVIKLIGPDGTELKSEEYTLDLANEEKNKITDFSDIELEEGEYKITSFGYNVDNDETVGNEIVFNVSSVPAVPDTGNVISSIGDFIKNDSAIILSVVLGVSLFGIVLKAKKGVRK